MKNKKLWIVLGILLITGLFIYASQKDLLPFAIPFCPGETGTITSIDRVDFSSYSNYFNGPAWVAEFRSLPSGQCLYGNFRADEIEDEDKKAKHGFAVDLISHTQYCNYKINRLKDIWVITKRVRFFEKEEDAEIWAEERWKEVGYDNNLKPKIIETCKVCWLDWEGYVYSWSKSYTGESIGDLFRPSLDWSTDIIFENKKTGEKWKETISSTEQKSVWVKDGKVLARWSGNLVDNAWCPSENTVGAWEEQGKWILTEPDLVNKFDNILSSFRNCVVNSRTREDVELCHRNFYVDYNNLKKGKKFCTPEDECAQVIGDKASIKLNRNLLINSITLYIKADVLGIFQEIGEPKIENIITEDLVSGSVGSVNIYVKNIGEGIGSFDIWIDCPSPFNVVTGTQTISLRSNEEKFISFSVGGNSIDDVSKICTAYMQERTSGERDSKSFVMKMIGSGTRCIPIGGQKCIGDKIFECDSSGKWRFIKDCKAENKYCKVVNEKAICVKEKPPITACRTCLHWLRNKISPGYCEPVTIIEKKWYNPMTWFLSGDITQDEVCPYILIFFGLVFLIILVIFVLLIKLITKKYRK